MQDVRPPALSLEITVAAAAGQAEAQEDNYNTCKMYCTLTSGAQCFALVYRDGRMVQRHQKFGREGFLAMKKSMRRFPDLSRGDQDHVGVPFLQFLAGNLNVFADRSRDTVNSENLQADMNPILILKLRSTSCQCKTLSHWSVWS